jgi:SAM-dependent methyltransferase
MENDEMSLVDTERAKYAELWTDVPDYRKYSPGMENVSRFMDIIKPEKKSTLLDVGCGTGDAGLEFARLGMNVRWIDITDAGLNKDIPRDHFIQAPLWMDWERNLILSYDYGFCCDVMEHIPTEYTMLVIDRIISVCEITWFQIALVPDQFGAVIGKSLHLTVKPFGWWLERLQSAGNIIDARDLCGQALYVVEKK